MASESTGLNPGAATSCTPRTNKLASLSLGFLTGLARRWQGFGKVERAELLVQRLTQVNAQRAYHHRRLHRHSHFVIEDLKDLRNPLWVP